MEAEAPKFPGLARYYINFKSAEVDVLDGRIVVGNGISHSRAQWCIIEQGGLYGYVEIAHQRQSTNNGGNVTGSFLQATDQR